MQTPDFVSYTDYLHFEPEEMVKRSQEFYELLDRRRSVRMFSDAAVDIEVLNNCIRAAGTAPSGAHMQPWHFVVVSDPGVKREIRIAAEKEEAAFYSGRAPKAWLDALSRLGTDENKEYLEIAPYLVILFAENYGLTEEGERYKHYYVSESVGIAAGMFIAAVHNAGLVTLTHTPSPMGFLSEILGRPDSERPFLLLPVGLPGEGVVVPNIERKGLEEIVSYR
jgi:nitroreductase